MLTIWAPDAVAAAAHHDVLRIFAAIGVLESLAPHAAVAAVIATVAAVVLIIPIIARIGLALILIWVTVVGLAVVGIVAALHLLVAGLGIARRAVADGTAEERPDRCAQEAAVASVPTRAGMAADHGAGACANEGPTYGAPALSSLALIGLGRISVPVSAVLLGARGLGDRHERKHRSSDESLTTHDVLLSVAPEIIKVCLNDA